MNHNKYLNSNPITKRVTFSKVINVIILFLFPVIVYRGYDFLFLDLRIFKLLSFIVIPSLFVYVLPEIIKSKDRISTIVKWILALFLLSIVSCYIFHDQSVILSYRASARFFCLIFYFFLKKANFSIRTIERLIWFYAILWIIIWGIALYFAPIPILGDPEKELSDARGLYRFFIAGDEFLYLLFFVSLTKWRLSRNKTLVLIPIALFVVIVLQLTRQTIVMSLCIALFYCFKSVKHFLIKFSIILCICIPIFANVLEDSPISKMTELSTEQATNQKNGHDNERVVEYRYFLFEMPNNPITMLIGNGMPHDDSSYGKFFLRLKDQRGIYLSDIGYPALYVIVGVFGVVAFFILLMRVVKIKVKPECDAYKLFVVFMLLANFVSFFVSVWMVCLSIACYEIQQEEVKKKRLVKTNDFNKLANQSTKL